MKTITVEVVVKGSVEKVWEHFTNPEHVIAWNYASEDWECPRATNDLRVGGEFHYIMAAKDKTAEFDFNGVYTAVTPHARIAYTIEDGRTVEVIFVVTEDGVVLAETFEMENENPEEMQRAGWQAILESFKEYVEARA